MKNRLKSTVMLILILTSLVSVSLSVPMARASDLPTVSDPQKGIKNSGNFENTLANDGTRKDPLSADSMSGGTKERWNFSSVDDWEKFAYLDGNKTRLIVGVDDKSASSLQILQNVAAEYGACFVNTVSVRGKPLAVVVEVDLASVSRFVEETRCAGLADYVEPNIKIQADFVPNDPYWGVQWGPKKIEADWAWNTTIGSAGLLVAVIDTGIDYNHPDLASNYVPLGFNWAYNNSDPLDDYGHGTHCAGIIAAVMNNSVGVAGVAQVKIMAEKVLDSSGWGYADMFANGVIHATDAGAKILSISLGGYGDSEIMHDSLKYAYDNGVLIVVAAGNSNNDIKGYPAGYSEVVAVTATDQNDQKAGFSSYGDWVELAAPGVSIYSTMPTYQVALTAYGYSMNYDYLSGTSMACPHVAGVAALVWSRYQNKSRDWVRLWLRATADDLGSPGFDVYYGYGRVNARKAVEQASPQHEVEASDLATPPYVKPGAQGAINGTILNFGDSDESNVVAQLWANDTMLYSQVLGLLPAGNVATVSFVWTPTLEGIYNVTLYVVPVPGETYVENNAISKYIFVGTPVKAVVLHSAGNVYSQIIANWQQLNSEWRLFGDTMVFIDYTSLNKENLAYADIAASEADVLIVSCASSRSDGWEFTDSEIEAIEQYVYEGHGLIVTAGTFYSSGAPNNNKLATLLGIRQDITWTATSTDLLELVNTTHPVFHGVPDPLVFPQLGTAIPSGAIWDMNTLLDGKYLALGHFSESAIVEHAGLLYISPWLEIVPPYYKHHLQLLYNAIIWTRYQMPQHDLIAHLETPTHFQPNETVQVNATALNAGVNDELNVELRLVINGTVVLSETIPELASGSSYTLSYSWNPILEGVYNVTVYVPPVSFEQSTTNNVESRTVFVRQIKYVLFDQTHGTDSIYLYSKWVESLISRNFAVATYTSGPITLDALSHCDVFIIPQAYYPYAESEILALQTYVQNGGGLLVIGDDYPDIYSSLTGFAGISWQYGGASGLTSDITPHLVTQGVNEVYLAAPVAFMTVTDPAKDLVRDQIREPMLAVSEQEEGKVLGFADENALWDDVITTADNLLLADNMIEWLAMKVTIEHDLSVTLDAPRSLEFGSSTTLTASVINRGRENETNVALELLIDDVVVASESIPFLAFHQSYAISLTWAPTTRGNYNITAYAPPLAMENRTYNNVRTVNVSVFFYAKSNTPGRWVGGGFPMDWHADDGSWPYDLPFSFPFYGLSFNRIFISSNGLITFGSPDLNYSNSIPELARKLAIAPAWHDWATYGGYDIYTQWNESCAVIRWDVTTPSYSAYAEFESILWIDGTIQFDYHTSSGFAPATVGISNGAGHIIAEDIDSINGTATRVFVPYLCDVAVYDVQASPTQIFSGQPAIINVTVGNRGELSETFPVQVFYTSANLTTNGRTSMTNQSSPNEPHEGDSVWIEPSYTDLSNLESGQRFNVTLWANITVPSFTWQIRLVYNSTLLNATGCGYTEDSQSQFFSGHTTVPVIPDFSKVDSNHSAVMFAETLLDSDERPAGSGSLCWIEFMIQTKPTVPFKEYLELDGSRTFVLDPYLAEIPITCIHSAYGAGAQTPPGPPNLIGEAIVHLNPGANTTLVLAWNTSGLPIGNYTFTAFAAPLLGETDLNNNNLKGGVVEILWRHDAAIVDVVTSTAWIYKGQNLTADVTVKNVGDAVENVTVFLYFNATPVEILGQGIVQNLLQNENRTITITLNTGNITKCTNYTLTAVALIPETDYNPVDNTLAGPALTIRFLGDINGDGKVDIKDVSMVARLFDTQVGDPNWNAAADLNFDGKINIMDIAITAKNFGKTNQ